MIPLLHTHKHLVYPKTTFYSWTNIINTLLKMPSDETNQIANFNAQSVYRVSL